MEIFILTNVNKSQAENEAYKNNCEYIQKIIGGYLIATNLQLLQTVVKTIKDNDLCKYD